MMLTAAVPVVIVDILVDIIDVAFYVPFVDAPVDVDVPVDVDAPILDMPLFYVPVVDVPVFYVPIVDVYVPVVDAPIIDIPVFDVPVFDVLIVNVPVVIFGVPHVDMPVVDVAVSLDALWAENLYFVFVDAQNVTLVLILNDTFGDIFGG